MSSVVHNSKPTYHYYNNSRAWHRQIQGLIASRIRPAMMWWRNSPKWLAAGEESIFSVETKKNLPGAYYELPEAPARTKKFPEVENLPDGL